jgi:hypothetical protein
MPESSSGAPGAPGFHFRNLWKPRRQETLEMKTVVALVLYKFNLQVIQILGT